MTYTARTLLADLQELTPDQLDLAVQTEGCDCIGPATGICIDGSSFDDDVIVITREDT